jgi:nucleotide-binding universal stress UspA family protein
VTESASLDRRIVVGVDGSAHSRRALRQAANEAKAHRARLEVVMAWTCLEQPGGHFDHKYNEARARYDLEAIVTDELGDAQPPKQR